MAPRKWIDRNNATTYRLVHRPQNDPLINDASASSMVFQETEAPQAYKKVQGDARIKDLKHSASELRSQYESSEFSLRDNEGEAAEHGVYFDDTEYDYMQHLRDIGAGEGEGLFVEAAPVAAQYKGKGKSKEDKKGISLDEALRNLDLEHGNKQKDVGKLLDASILPSKNLRYITYQTQQDVPDALNGFQPDMDWRLREALEALDNDEYVDNDDQDLFDSLAKGGEEIDDLEFEETEYESDEAEGDGWESDGTAKPDIVYDCNIGNGYPSQKDMSEGLSVEVGALPSSDAAPPDAISDPLAAFHAHKSQLKSARPIPSIATGIQDSRIHGGAAASTVLTDTSLLSGRHKKRKGALTSASAYSMTSSVLARTEGQTLLDARFNKVLETQYEEGEEGDFQYVDDTTASIATGVTGTASLASRFNAVGNCTQDPVRVDYSDVMGIMDDFLGGFGGGPAQPGDSKANKRRGGKTRRGYRGQTGMEQLDDIRKELGRPRLAGVR